MGVVFCLSLPLFSFLCFPVGCCFVAPLEEKKTTGDRNERQRRWRGRAGWSFCVFCCLSFFFCSSLLCPSSTVCSLVFFPVLPVLALLNRKWLLWVRGRLVWGSVDREGCFGCRKEMAERGEWPREGLVLGVLSFSFTKLSSLPSLQNRPPPLLFQRCLASLLPFPLSRSPLLVFQPSLFSKTLPPLLQLRQRGAGQQHAHGEQGTPSQGSLRCSPACAAPHS